MFSRRRYSLKKLAMAAQADQFDVATSKGLRIQMIVAESGSARTGTWKLESQNVYEDYKRAFGAEPGRIKAIAIMTDTDNTGASVEAYYGDIAFMSEDDARRVSLAPGKVGSQRK